MNKLTEIQKSYIAGFIDGEGCINISKTQGIRNRTPCYGLRVIVSQSGKNKLNKFQEETGIGKIYQRTIWQFNCYDWILNAHESVELLNTILPYLRLKTEEAKIAIEYQSKQGRHHSMGRNHQLDPTFVEEKEYYYQKLRDMKGASSNRGRKRKT